ncbi:MAG: NifB/NifX family molybdenum-iron cluster-binding protein [Peptococcaceae bacterium]|nr:NifB/NifX family molybdenum-iron cluster-binding protein [Candidatus Syntrophopropionicum ammoniitolerans]
MKIAITSVGQDLESKIDARFGRAKWFIVIDTETNQHQVISNEHNLNISQGAGIQTAENISRHNVEAVITGNCGPKAFTTLNSAGIKVYSAVDGTVAEVLEKFKNGKLKQAGGANVEGHWA